MADEKPKLRLGALVSLVAGSMIGAGIFSLPQNMAASASAGVVLVGWLITAAGMLMLAFVFQTLSNRRPDLDAGIYAYAKAGFGDYMGFSSAWGYWISAWLGNVSYLVLEDEEAELEDGIEKLAHANNSIRHCSADSLRSQSKRPGVIEGWPPFRDADAGNLP